MRVTIPLGGFNRSGGVKTLVVLANAMAERGWRVRLLVPDYASTPTFDLSPEVDVRRLATGAGPHALRVAFYYLALAATAAHDADVCLANFYLTAHCAFVSRLFSPSTRVVYFLQGDEAESHGRLAPGASRWLRFAVARASYRLPVPIFCVSEWLRDRVRRPDAVVVGQGIDLAVFSPAPRAGFPRPVVIGTIGSVARVKGYEDLLSAIAAVAGESFELLVAANEPVDRPAAGRTVSVTSEAGMASFYNACDVFVFASHREGFGLPPLEAMACGCAVITTDCGGVRDFARDGENCVMVPVGDPDALGSAIRRVLGDAPLRARLAAEGVRTAAAWPRTRLVGTFIDHLWRMAPAVARA